MAQTFAAGQFARVPADSLAIGASSILVLMLRSADSGGSNQYAASLLDGIDGHRVSLGFGTTDLLRTNGTSGIAQAATLNGKVADGWICVGVTRAAGGSVTPRFHKHVYSTGVSSHENATATVGGGGAAPASLAVARFNVASDAGAIGDYAWALVYPIDLSDQQFEQAATTLLGGLSLSPTYAAVIFDGAGPWMPTVPGVVISNTGTASTSSTVQGYGHPVFVGEGDPPGSTATFTGTGYLTATSGAAVYPPAALAQTTGAGNGFTFALVSPAQVMQDIHFTTTGDFTHDQNRSVRRAISGFRLLPSEAAKVNMASDEVYAFLDVNGESFPMGVFRFTESSRVKDAIIDDSGNPADLIDVALSDRFVTLQRSSESPLQIVAGSDPSQEMIRVLNDTGIPHSITGAVAPIADNVVWQPFTTDEEIVSQLAELAGHRRPWADNYGIIRSVEANVVDTEIIDLMTELHPVAGTIVVTENYLSAPNRVVVFDDQGAFPITGSWDAPASAPNSFVNRGWILTAGVPQQGLSGAIHAQQVARAFGEQMAARTMTCQILPTNRLDGPIVVAYDDALWLTESWSVSSAPGSLMSASFRELLIENGQDA